MATRQDATGTFRKYVVEFLGTFFLVMTICMTVAGGLGHMSSLSAGLMLMIMIYAGFHISGAHYNPAVSLAAYLRGKLDAGDLLPYIVAQFLGGTLAAMLAGFLLNAEGVTEVITRDLTTVPTLIAELFGTILFVFVFLNLTTVKKTAGNDYFGLAIGMTYAACHFTFGPVSIGAFNPAVALGVTMANLASWSSVWIFIVANVAGGVLAAFLSQYVNGPEI